MRTTGSNATPERPQRPRRSGSSEAFDIKAERKKMKRIIATVSAMLIFAGIASAKDLKTYKATYEKQMEEIILSHGMKMTDPGQQYTKSLDALLAKVKKAGDLDKTTGVMDEIARFRNEKGMPDKPSKLLDIQHLQSSFTKQTYAHEAQKAKSIISLTSRYDQALERLQKTLVSSSKLDDAKVVQEERRATQSSAEILNAKKIILASSSKKMPHPSRESTPTKKLDLPPDAFEALGHNYYLFDKPMTWSAATEACRQKKGHILSIDNKQEYEHFYQFAREHNKTIWIDLSLNRNKGLWLNWKGEKAKYIKWEKGEPNSIYKGQQENYIVLGFKRGNMFDTNEYKEFYIVCEWD